MKKRVVEVLLWVIAIGSVIALVVHTKERLRKAENAAIAAEMKAEQNANMNVSIKQQIEAVHQERKKIAEQIRDGEQSVRQIKDPVERQKAQALWRQQREALEKTSNAIRDKIQDVMNARKIDVQELKQKTQEFKSKSVPQKSAE